jgi:hypothetical protein
MSTRIVKGFCRAIENGDCLTKHDWNVRQEEDQVDQIMLAFPDRKSHCDGLDKDCSLGRQDIKTQREVG